MTLSVRLLRITLYSHLFLALCAVSLWFSTRLIFGLPVECSSQVLLLASATVLYYNFHKFSYRFDNYHPARVLRRMMDSSVSAVDRLLFILAALTFSISFLLQPPWVMIIWMFLVLLSIGYSLPVFHDGNSYRRLREKPLLKIIVVAFVWTVTTVGLPLANELAAVPWFELAAVCVSRFTLIFALCVPFEIRDERKELQRGINSLMKFGKQRVVRWTLAAVFFSVLLLIVYWLQIRTAITFVKVSALIVTQLIAIYWLLTTRADRPAWFFKGCVDGTLLLPLVFLILFSLWL
jgi:hypothetical protein